MELYLTGTLVQMRTLHKVEEMIAIPKTWKQKLSVHSRLLQKGSLVFCAHI